MHYTLEELVLYLFIYSFLGWGAEVAIMAIKTGKFCNRGFLNLPLCMTYGITMDILIVFFPMVGGSWVFQVIAYVLVASVAAYLSGGISKRLLGTPLWDFESLSLFSGGKRNWMYGLVLGIVGLLVVWLIQPFVYLLGTLIPSILLKIVAAGLCALLVLDFIAVIFAMRHKKLRPSVQNLVEDVSGTKASIGKGVSHYIWRRLHKAYPELKENESDAGAQYVFAQGLCLDKLVWVFLIGALVGDLVETVFVRLVSGIWMSRSSVIYGPFSLVWGAGAVLLTVVLQKLAQKGDRYVFIGGFFLGGIYEYMCSVFTEVFLGTTFWDYSDQPFNIGGRTNLVFCLYWGVLSVVWIKWCYPYLSHWIEKIPAIIGKVFTWLVVVMFMCNIVISGMAVLRYVDRAGSPEPSNAIAVFLDYHYPDDLVEFIYPNMRIDSRLVAPLLPEDQQKALPTTAPTTSPQVAVE